MDRWDDLHQEVGIARRAVRIMPPRGDKHHDFPHAGRNRHGEEPNGAVDVGLNIEHGIGIGVI